MTSTVTKKQILNKKHVGNGSTNLNSTPNEAHMMCFFPRSSLQGSDSLTSVLNTPTCAGYRDGALGPKRARLASCWSGAAEAVAPDCYYPSSSCSSISKLKGNSGGSSYDCCGTLYSSALESVTTESGHGRPKGPYAGCIPWENILENR